MTDPTKQRLRIAMSSLGDAIPRNLRRPPLGWLGVRAWEAEHVLELPEPYRTFVAEISNGTREGPSTTHGLLPLGQFPESWQRWEAECWPSPEPFDGTAPQKPAVPFPLKEEWQWEYDYYDHNQHSPLLHGVHQHGSILLGGNRGREFWILIVTGPQRGRVWWLGDGCAAPYVDAGEEAEPEVDFVSWLQDWQSDRGWWCQHLEDLD
ncbi:SMI1/KNR4 family protein [Streptomyces sp900116325]|uniref:SMI1/KNR4 family protein n=1 Tax=Streptomyces sp. 900116325 TaxID=3154295 RepID=A0ABV2U8H3_9ACTN